MGLIAAVPGPGRRSGPVLKFTKARKIPKAAIFFCVVLCSDNLIAAGIAVAAEKLSFNQRDILALWDCLSSIFKHEVEEHVASDGAVV